MMIDQVAQDGTEARLAPAPSLRGAGRWEPVVNLWYHWRTAAIVAGTILLIGLIAALLMPAKYRSEGRLLALTADYYDIRADRPGAPPAPSFEPADVLNLEMQILSSTDVQRDVVTRLGVPAGDAVAVDRAMGKLQQGLHIGKTEEANVIDLSFSDRDPVRAAETLKAVIDVYFARRADVLTSGRAERLTKERDAAKERLDTLDREIAAFQAQNGIVDIDAQIAGAVQVDTQLRQTKLDADAERSRASGNLGTLRAGANSLPQTIELYRDDSEAAAALGQMQTRLLDLEARRADLSSRYMAGAPQLEQIDQEIASVKRAISDRSAALKSARRVGRNGTYDTVQDRMIATSASVAGERARGAALASQIAQSSERLRTLNALGRTLTELKLRREVLVESYRALSLQAEQARAEQAEAATGSTNIRVIQAPTIPDSRIHSPLMIVAGSLVAAVLAGLAAALAHAMLRPTYLTAAAAAAGTGLPVVGSVSRRELRKNDGVSRGVDRTVSTLLNGSAPSAVIALVSPQRDTALWPLGQALGRGFNWRKPGRTVRVEFESGLYPGKSQTVPVEVSTEDGAPVDDHSVASATTGIDPMVGDIVLDDGAIVRVGSRAWPIEGTGDKLIAQLRADYAHTLILAPPATETEIIGDIVAVSDQVVVVVEAERTTQGAIETLVSAVAQANGTVSGIIFAGERDYRPLWFRRLLS